MSHPTTEQATSNPGYETRDVSIRAVLWLGVGIAGGTALACALLWLLLVNFIRRAEHRDPAPSPLAAQHEDPPAPRLQETPLADYRAFRAHEDELLSTYGWANKEKTAVRIPIERAMELLVERGETAVTGTNSSEEEKSR